MLGQDRNSRGTPAEPVPTSEVLVERALLVLDRRFEGWREALQQDAVESISRVGLIRQYRGVLLPVHDMVAAPLARAVDTLTRRFIEEAAPIVANEVGRPTSELEMLGRGLIEPLAIAPAEADLVIARGAFEGNITWRRRFETTLVETVDTLYTRRVRSYLQAQLKAILAAWA